MVSPQDIPNKKVVVLGLAKSGLAAAALLIRHGASVVGSDLSGRDALPDFLGEMEKRGLRTELGHHPEGLLDGADFLVVSPGVPVDSPTVKNAVASGLPVYGEIEVASWFCPASIVAVTGSNGKTTTTTLLGDMFRRAGREVEVAGNIGAPFADAADRLTSRGTAVLEVSSFQLETIETFRPQTSLLLNFSPDHLDRHHGYEAYVAAKMRIFENQTEADRAVVNSDDQHVLSASEAIRPSRLLFSTRNQLDEGVCVSGPNLVARFPGSEQVICRVEDILLPGPHNLSNVAAAAAVAMVNDIDTDTIHEAVRHFTGVAHRLEIVGEIDGVTFVNDSKATNVVSVQYALQSFQDPIVLIAGGREKDTDFRPLRPLVNKKVKQLVLLGEAAPKIRAALADVIETYDTVSMTEAVTVAFRAARRGDVVLLSPACASFDMYTNFEERGADFMSAVAELQRGNT